MHLSGTLTKRSEFVRFPAMCPSVARRRFDIIFRVNKLVIWQ